MKNVIIYGASGHGRVVGDIVRLSKGYSLFGFIDDDEQMVGGKFCGVLVIGNKGTIIKSSKEWVNYFFHIGIGDNAVRNGISKELSNSGLNVLTLIHPSAVIANDVTIGKGCAIMAGAVINSGTVIGDNVILNTGCTVDHDCRIADGVHISPGVNIAGDVIIGEESHVGLGSSIIPGIRIGGRATVGAGAVVIRDVESGVTVVGNPARRLIGPKISKRLP